MNKKRFVERMVEHTDSPKSEAEKHLEAFTASVSEALKAGEEVQLPGFGKFYVREQKAREGRNPQTGDGGAGSRHLRRKSTPKCRADGPSGPRAWTLCSSCSTSK